METSQSLIYKSAASLITYFLSTIIVFFVLTPTLAQQSTLQSGPMVGYSEMKEVQLWVQTRQPGRVKIGYWEKGIRSKELFTTEVNTQRSNAYVAKLLADEVKPGKTYEYKVYLNNKPVSFSYPLQFKTQMLRKYQEPAPDFTFAVGSCNHVNDTTTDRYEKPFGGGYEIFNSIHAKKPDFMMWLGDNTYLREADWNTQTGIFYRYTHTRSLPEIQPLLGSVHHYAIWDDHDYGPNDYDRSFWNKNLTFNAFNTFWCNPNTNLTGQGGITGTFQWADVQFFLMDDRWFRSPNNRSFGERSYLGKAQVEWLIDALINSRATFKFICIGGQVLNPVATKENYSNYEEELNYLLKSIREADVKGILFLTGDRHHTELTRMPRSGTYPLYDLTVSALTSRSHNANENNYLRVENTLIGEKNFGILSLSGTTKERTLTIQIYNTNGEPLWDKQIKASELR